jgi:hypothetical protein
LQGALVFWGVRLSLAILILLALLWIVSELCRPYASYGWKEAASLRLIAINLNRGAIHASRIVEHAPSASLSALWPGLEICPECGRAVLRSSHVNAPQDDS